MSSSNGSSVSTEPPSQLRPDLPPIPLRYVPLPAPLPSPAAGAVHVVASEDLRAPCRRCLHDAEPGEEVVLLGYDPFPSDSVTPYRGEGPIFVHAHACKVLNNDIIPERQLARLLSLRAYDEKHMMVAAEVIPGSQLETVGGAMLADEKAKYIHVHNAKPGCFAFKAERA